MAGGRKPPATRGSEFLSIEECARFFGVSTEVIYRWRGRGLFQAFGALYEMPGGPHRKIVRFHRGACEKMRASFVVQPSVHVFHRRGQA